MSTYKPIWIQRPLKRFLPKNLPDQICLSPFVSMSLSADGGVTLCGCSGWLPSEVGNLLNHSLDEILANVDSTAIRQSIIDGTYDFCNESTCGVIKHHQLGSKTIFDNQVQELFTDAARYIMPREIFIAGDVTCNLSCPSCRKHVIKNSDEDHARLENLGRILKSNLFCTPTDQVIRLHISTSGELFASPMLLAFVNDIPVDDFPRARLDIQTNGLLVPERWHRLGSMQDRVDSITVTVDAARPDTYERLRRGGTWTGIQTALTWIADKKLQNNMKFKTRMVVQHDNFEEMLEFYDMCKNLGVDVIEYTRITNWGTYTRDEFALVDVFDPAHTQHQQAQQCLDQIKNLFGVFLHGGL